MLNAVMNGLTMTRFFVFLVCAAPWFVLASDGFVRKAGEGFLFFNGITEKVSPETGSEKSILAEQVFEMGGTTGLHVHDQGDEIFYVAKGTGVAHLDGTDHQIGPGDVVFIPRGAVHEMSNPHSKETLVVVFFMDSSELFDEFRAIKKRLEDPTPITDEDRAYFRSFNGSRRVQR